MREHAKLLAATLMASSLILAAIGGTAFAGPIEFFQGVYQDLFGPTQFEKAKAAYDSKDYATAAQLWQPLADHGDAMAQFYLGWLYEAGMGVPRNYAEAAKWYRLSAEQHNALAQSNLAGMYLDGRGVPKDEGKALRLYCRAADSGEPIAQDYLTSRPDASDLYELCQ
jgi:TPR repeat protein